MKMYVEDGIKDAERNKAKAILFQIDTYGGRIDSAISISDYILNSHIPTIAYIKKKSISAGVLISISCDYIYMAPGGTIGSAETIPNTEKILSAWKKQLKSVAELKNRNSKIVLAMADKNMNIDGIVKKGELLNLTTLEANQINFIDAIADSRFEIYKSLNLDNIKEKVFNRSFLHDFLMKISANSIMPILFFIGFAGTLIEILSPGFGLGGILAILGFGMFFISNYYEGGNGTISSILFILAIVLIAIEILVPGFGIFGVIGIAALSLALLLGASSFGQGIFYMIGILMLIVIIAIIYIKKITSEKPSNSRLDLMIKEINRDKEDDFFDKKN